MRPRNAAALLAVAGAALAGGIVAAGGDDPAAAQDDRGAESTATVERRTLTERLRADGTLGFADERPVLTRLQGTVTWLPPEGSVVEPGKRILELDDEPVILFDGWVPAWRAMRSGDEGQDVLQLERGLRDLGLDVGEVDGEFDSDTTDAVLDWQEARGLAETGTVELGRVVFLPGRRRIAERKAQLGQPLQGAPLETTSTRRVVTLAVDAADQQVAREGAKVEVELPDGTLTPGRISRVGKVAKAAAGDDPGGAPTVEVVVRLTGKQQGGALDQAPVSVELARDRRKGVLAVPVTALIAQRGGGYAVEVVGAGAKGRLVPVTPGLFADGLVEIEGEVREGDRVAVPAT